MHIKKRAIVKQDSKNNVKLLQIEEWKKVVIQQHGSILRAWPPVDKPNSSQSVSESQSFVKNPSAQLLSKRIIIKATIDIVFQFQHVPRNIEPAQQISRRRHSHQFVDIEGHQTSYEKIVYIRQRGCLKAIDRH